MRVRQGYDVIIIGAGASGCALAARLSEDPARSVLLVEAGARYAAIDAYPPELRYGALLGASAPGHPANWGFVAKLTAEVHQPITRGRVVGGSTVLNGMVFTRGLAEDFDGWAREGNDAWSYETVLPYFRKLERDREADGNHHGRDGPMPVNCRPRGDWVPSSHAFIAACGEAGFPQDPDMNAPGSIGHGALPLNSVDGVRFNAALAYLDPARDRANLEVLPDTLVHKLIFSGNRAIGIVAQRNDGETIEIHGGEIVLSAGSVKSPQLLMLSGIGPAEELRAFGIPVLYESPHVGRNFTDHCALHFPVRVPGLSRRRFDPAKAALSEVGLHYTAAGSDEHSDMMLMPLMVPFNIALVHGATLGRRLRMLALGMRQMSWTRLKEQLFDEWDLSIVVILMQGRSRGEVRLTSADPRAHPALDYHYLEVEEDRRRLRDGMRLCARLVASGHYRAIGARNTALSDVVLESDALLDQHIRHHVGTSLHLASSCRMGRAVQDSVVDQHCRVHGIANLRVVDTSIMPRVVRRCPNASAIMIGERAADFF
jgi:choline dehydrogenase-like flavoprotein